MQFFFRFGLVDAVLTPGVSELSATDSVISSVSVCHTEEIQTL